MSCVVVEARDVVGADLSGERHAPQAELPNERSKAILFLPRRRPASASRQGTAAGRAGMRGSCTPRCKGRRSCGSRECAAAAERDRETGTGWCRPRSGSRWRRCRTWRTPRRGNATARRSAGPIAPPTARPVIARDGRAPRRCGNSGRPAAQAAAPREWPAGAPAGTRSTMPRIRARRRHDGGGGRETGYR